MRGRSIMVLTALVPVALFVGQAYWAFPGFHRGG
jgi:hypothetical protein